MAKEITMKADLRTEQGSAAARRLRRKGVLPAVVKRLTGVSEAISLEAHAFEKTMRHHSGDSVLVTLEVDGVAVPTLLREVQHDVLDGAAIHADFGEISLTKLVRVSIQIKLHGEADGVKNAGGILDHSLRQIEVECLPADLIETIDVDVSALKLGESLTVSDLGLDARYTVLTQDDSAVASVIAPSAEEEDESDDEDADAAEGEDEPEVIAKGKADEAEDAGHKK